MTRHEWSKQVEMRHDEVTKEGFVIERWEGIMPRSAYEKSFENIDARSRVDSVKEVLQRVIGRKKGEVPTGELVDFSVRFRDHDVRQEQEVEPSVGMAKKPADPEPLTFQTERVEMAEVVAEFRRKPDVTSTPEAVKAVQAAGSPDPLPECPSCGDRVREDSDDHIEGSDGEKYCDINCYNKEIHG